MSTVAEDIVTLLEGLSLDDDSTIVIGQMAATPDDLIVVRTQAGKAPDGTIDGVIIERQTLVLLFRSADYSNAMTRAITAWNGLYVYNTLVNGNAYLMIEPLNNPTDVGTDANKRRVVSFTLDIRKEDPI